MIGSMIAFALIAPQSVGGFGVFAVTAGTPVPQLVVGILIALGITHGPDRGLNAAIERVAYKPLRHAPKLAPLISAIGMSFVLQNVGVVLAGSNQRTIDNVFPTNNLLAPFGITAITITTSSRSSSAS